MSSSEIRVKAREILTGKWGKVAIIMLIQGAIMYGAQLVSNFTGGILSIAVTICSVPIEYGLYMSFMKIRKNENVDYGDFLKDGFKNFGRSWGIVGNTLLKMWPLILSYVVSIIILVVGIILIAAGSENAEDGIMITGIILTAISIIALYVSIIWMVIRGLLYSLANYIAIDKPEISTKEAVEESSKLMSGNRGKFFILGLSFIGWGILCIFTLGIGALWLTPYVTFSEIVFYEMLKGKTDTVEVITENK